MYNKVGAYQPIPRVYFWTDIKFHIAEKYLSNMIWCKVAFWAIVVSCCFSVCEQLVFVHTKLTLQIGDLMLLIFKVFVQFSILTTTILIGWFWLCSWVNRCCHTTLWNKIMWVPLYILYSQHFVILLKKFHSV